MFNKYKKYSVLCIIAMLIIFSTNLNAISDFWYGNYKLDTDHFARQIIEMQNMRYEDVSDEDMEQIKSTAELMELEFTFNKDASFVMKQGNNEIKGEIIDMDSNNVMTLMIESDGSILRLYWENNENAFILKYEVFDFRFIQSK